MPYREAEVRTGNGVSARELQVNIDQHATFV
jgi:hypothetical protein